MTTSAEQPPRPEGTRGRPASPRRWRFGTAGILAAVAAGVILLGAIPRLRQRSVLAHDAAHARAAVLTVRVVSPHQVTENSLALPGSIDAIQQTSINARTDGYVGRLFVDIGSRVTAGQLLAKIESPELDQQLLQARADAAKAAHDVTQQRANLRDKQAQAELARANAVRYRDLAGEGFVAMQVWEQARTALKAAIADVGVAKAAVNSAAAAYNSAEANVRRYQAMQSFESVRAPFSGVIVSRNVDEGSLISSGAPAAATGAPGAGTSSGVLRNGLFGLARTDRLRIEVQVPQAMSTAIAEGQAAAVTVAEFPHREFNGQVFRIAGGLDPTSRTRQVEVRLSNPRNVLVPGMYAGVRLTAAGARPSLRVPAGALVSGAQGTQVATFTPERKVHFVTVQIGRDFGQEVEIVEGLRGDEQLVANPTDAAKEGTPVQIAPPR